MPYKDPDNWVDMFSWFLKWRQALPEARVGASPPNSDAGSSSGIQSPVRGSAGHADTQASRTQLLAEPLGTLLSESALLNCLF